VEVGGLVNSREGKDLVSQRDRIADVAGPDHAAHAKHLKGTGMKGLAGKVAIVTGAPR
jgi:hypothetical protein